MPLKRYCLVLAAFLILVGREAALTQSTPAFPLKASADQRYLVDQSGVAFPIVGRALWELVSISTSDRNTILADTVNRAYNAVEMRAPSRIPSSPRAPFDGDGNLPFLKRLDGAPYTGNLSYGNVNNEAPDFTTPNEAYWSRLDSLFNDCLSRNLLVMYFPAYNGYQGGSEGWMPEMVANGTSRMQTYGAWAANRYKNQRNLVWLIAGDYGTVSQPYNSNQRAVEEAFVTGLQSISGQSSILISAEGADGSVSTDLPNTLAAAISLNGSYSFQGLSAYHGRRAYARSPAVPSFQIEEPYDEEGPDGTGKNPAATQPTRRFQWWGWLTTIGGVMHGNGYVIHFSPNWQNHLATQTTQDMTRMAGFMRSIPWHRLVPSGLGGARTLITAGGSTSDAADYVAAAVTPDGAWLIAYIPPSHSGSITVDMSALGGLARARWFDPTSGTYSDVGTMLPNSGGRSFTPPGNNSAGARDWVLVLSTGSETAPPAAPTNLRIVR